MEQLLLLLYSDVRLRLALSLIIIGLGIYAWIAVLRDLSKRKGVSAAIWGFVFPPYGFYEGNRFYGGKRPKLVRVGLWAVFFWWVLNVFVFGPMHREQMERDFNRTGTARPHSETSGK